MERLDLVSYGVAAAAWLYMLLWTMTRVRGYNRAVVRGASRLFLIVWVTLAMSMLAGLRCEVAASLPRHLDWVLVVLMVASIFYFGARAQFEASWGAPPPGGSSELNYRP